MKKVGIRELNQDTSRIVACAKAGETVTITEHGKPVARLVPIRKSRIEELIEEGSATPPTGDIRELPPPRPREPGERSMSEVLEEMRRDERY